jgi:hypothetical protein
LQIIEGYVFYPSTRSPSVVPSGSCGATGRKSAPSPVATEESSSEEDEEEEHEVQQQDDEVQGREEGEGEEDEDEEEEEEEEEAGVEARSEVYVRGHSTLSERPILPANRPIIRPEGTR